MLTFLAFSSPAFWCRHFRSCIFHPSVFDAPAFFTPAISVYSTVVWSGGEHWAGIRRDDILFRGHMSVFHFAIIRVRIAKSIEVPAVLGSMIFPHGVAMHLSPLMTRADCAVAAAEWHRSLLRPLSDEVTVYSGRDFSVLAEISWLTVAGECLSK